MPILALSTLTGKNTTTQGRGIALGLTLLVAAALVATGQTAFKGGSLESMALTMTGMGMAGVDSVAALALLIMWGAEKRKKKEIRSEHSKESESTSKEQERYLEEVKKEREHIKNREMEILQQKDQSLSPETVSLRAQVIMRIEMKFANEALMNNEEDYQSKEGFTQARELEESYHRILFDKTPELNQTLDPSEVQKTIYNRFFYASDYMHHPLPTKEEFLKFVESECSFHSPSKK